MSYFSYLGMTKKEDNQKTFKEFLIEIMDYDEDVAQRESILYYM